MKRLIVIAALLPALTACDALKQRLGLPDPAKIEAEGKAIGGACRNAGRGLEDCYRLNQEADKAAVYAGWKEMNEYMAKNNMQAIPPEVPAKAPAKEETAGEHGKAADKKEAAKTDTESKAEAKAGADKDKKAEAKPEAKAEAKAEAKDKKGEDKKGEAKTDAKTHEKPAGGH
jgi:hypothetical protein